MAQSIDVVPSIEGITSTLYKGTTVLSARSNRYDHKKPGGGPSTCGEGLLDGLIEYWSPIDDVWTGRHAGNDGELNNGATIVDATDVPGGFACLMAAASEQYINVPDFIASHINGDFTLSGRFLCGADIDLDTLPFVVCKTINDYPDETHPDPYGIFTEFGEVDGYARVNTQDVWYDFDLLTDVWYYATVVYQHDNNTVTLYTEGIERSTFTYGGTFDIEYDDADFLFGKDNGNNNRGRAYWEGQISDAALWSRQLSADEILSAKDCDYAEWT